MYQFHDPWDSPAQVPMRDVQAMWPKAADSWSGLQTVLENRFARPEGMDDALVDHMIRVAQEMDRTGESFPDSPQRLHDILNNRRAVGLPV